MAEVRLADGLVGGALEHAEASFPQPGIEVDRQAEHRGECRRGLLRSAQVARVDRADRTVSELRRGLGRLAQPAFGQFRLVVVSLGETCDVPG